MSIKIQVDLEQLRELQKQFEQKPDSIMPALADALVGAVRRHIYAAAPALSAATLEIRKKEGITGTAPLIATTHTILGSLAPRSTAFSAAATVAWPAAALQKGFVTGAGSAIPGKTVPARPFVYLDEAEKTMAMDRIEQLYLGRA